MTQPLDLERAEKRLSEVAVALAHLSCGMALGAAYGHARSPEKVLAGDLRNLLDALSSERAAREDAEGEIDSLRDRAIERTVRAETAEAQVSALQAACYVASEPHLSGYRVILGFDTLNAAQDAHEALARARASQPPADEPTKGEG